MRFGAKEYCTNNRGFSAIENLAGVEAALGRISHAGIATHAMESNRPDVALTVEGRAIKHHLQNKRETERQSERERDTQKKRDRDRERQRETERDRKRQRETERQRERKRKREREKEKEREKQTGRQRET